MRIQQDPVRGVGPRWNSNATGQLHCKCGKIFLSTMLSARCNRGKSATAKLPLERIRVDKVAQQIIIQSLHSSTGALDLVEIVIAVNLDPFCLLTNVSPLFRLTSDEVWRT